MTDLINLLSWRQWAVGSVAVLIVLAALIYVYAKDRREDLYLQRRSTPLRDPGPTLDQLEDLDRR